MISRRSRKALLICAAICIVLVPLVSVRASKTTFYPDECIGDWKELQNAEGKTDVRVITSIGTSDAAESNRIGSRIVCSKFSDDSLSNVRPTFAELTLFVQSMGSVSTPTVVSRILKKYSTNVFAEEDTSTSTIGEVDVPILPEISNEYVEQSSTTPIVEPTTTTFPVPNEVGIDEPVLTSATSTESHDEVSTTTINIEAVNTTHTQTEEVVVATTTVASTTPFELIQGTQDTGTTTDDGLDETLLNHVSSTEVQEVLFQDTEIETQVSFDEGVTWLHIGNSVVSGAEPISFMVPLHQLKTGDDVSKLSVRIIKTAGSAEILLDGMSLSVGFVPLTDSDKKVVLGDILEKNPDFSTGVITQMINVPHFQVISTRDTDGIASLWVYADTPSGTTTPFLVATGERFVSGAPIAVKDGIVFWQNSVDDVYGFRVNDQRILVPLSRRERESGEREFIFSETPWKIVSRGGSIYFFSRDIGEIGGDDDGSLRQVFYSNRLEIHFSQQQKESLGEFGVDTGVIVSE